MAQWPFFGKLAAASAAIIFGLAIIAIARTAQLPARPNVVDFVAPPAALVERAAGNLQRAIALETISYGAEGGGSGRTTAAFAQFRTLLEEAYPAAHQAMTRHVVNDRSIYFRWPGQDRAAKPVALAAHIDVVPVEAGTEEDWSAPAFSGLIEDGAVWGRGAMDDKGSLIAIMEAAERLAAAGFRPARDVYFLFGHDEEIGGLYGAGAIVNALREQGVQFEWVLDEGSAVVEGLLPGMESPLALISLAEKGWITLELVVEAEGGHSSTPSDETAATILARALVRIADAPYPLEIDATFKSLLRVLAPSLPFAQRLALSNLWLTSPIVKSQLGGDPALAAMMRTTTAVTVVRAGAKENILPQKARALINYRIHPRNDPEGVRARTERLINDERVSIRVRAANAASPVSDPNGAGYKAVAAAIQSVYGEIPIAPSLTLAATDQRHYGKISDNAYRFYPFLLEPDDLKRIHGTDERLDAENLAQGVLFYETLLRRPAG